MGKSVKIVCFGRFAVHGWSVCQAAAMAGNLNRGTFLLLEPVGIIQITLFLAAGVSAALGWDPNNQIGEF